MASRTPTSGTEGRGGRPPPSAPGSVGRGQLPALEPREPGWIGGRATPAVAVARGAVGVATDAEDSGGVEMCSEAAGFVRPPVAARKRSPGSSPRPVRNRPEEGRRALGCACGVALWSSSVCGDRPSFCPAAALTAKGVGRMKEAGSSTSWLNFRSMFSRRARKIWSSSSSDSSSLRISAVCAAGGLVMNVPAPPAPPCRAWGTGREPWLGLPLRSETRSWLASSSRMPSCVALLCRVGMSDFCREWTLRILPRLSFKCGPLLFACRWKQPEPRRYHGLTPSQTTATPGGARGAGPGPRVQGLSVRSRVRRDRKSCTAGRQSQLAMSLDDRLISSSAGKHSPPSPAAAGRSSFSRLTRFDVKDSFRSRGRMPRAFHCMNWTRSFASRMSSSRALSPRSRSGS
mmetsp:Transcript_22263/g.62469  ORF Transcript_22263/g.62469 Transcript_22263/m.62469 type:complete len:402 (+) Transcript_22263:560-1765(+)